MKGLHGRIVVYATESFHATVLVTQEFLIFAGGILTMTGDVLPCFDASAIVIPEDASCIITVPITLDIASNHGVVVASKTGIQADRYTVSLVDNLLQKPSVEELAKNQALLDDGRTLLDTGMIAVRGEAWLMLVKLACSCQPMITELLENRKEVSYNFQVIIINPFSSYCYINACTS